MDFNNPASAAITRKDIDYVCDHDTGQVWILHGKPFESQKTLKSVSFNSTTGEITLHGADNHTQLIPIPILPPIAPHFSNANQVTVIYTHGGEVLDLHILPLTTTS